MKQVGKIVPLALLVCLAWVIFRRAEEPVDARVRVLESGTVPLGRPGEWEWEENRNRKGTLERFEHRFTAKANTQPAVLAIRQAGVKRSWGVHLNGKRLGSLATEDGKLELLFDLPPGSLAEGENHLVVEPPKELDDITLGPVRIIDAPRETWLRGGEIHVRVTDAATDAPLPCRLTVTRSDGTLQPLLALPETEVAVRTGVVYTRAGEATLFLPEGEYRVQAGRGFEWGLVSGKVKVRSEKRIELALSLPREVDTRGWIAVDSHIHTRALSGHGDATLRERVLTVAGEGIELAVATEHNHHGDYGPAAVSAGLADRFTAVGGNEVTTKHGHFNAFPIEPGSAVAPHGETDWAKLLPAVRSTPGVRVVTLNHPRDAHSGFVPLGEAEFEADSGIHRREDDLRVDAIEVITSGAMQSDILLLYRDWFALLNRGHRLSAVGSSDSHDVNRFLLGQGRTYVAAPDENPSRLDLDAVWKSYGEGRLLVSLGLLAMIRVDDRFTPGDLATGLSDTVKVEATVLGPSWSRTDHVALYANGILLRESALEDPGRAGEKARLSWEIPRPRHDVHLVVIATGPGSEDPAWPIPRPYQPSDPAFVPRVIGSTNPVWLDADGDGRFQSARDLARRLLEVHGREPSDWEGPLRDYDEAVAIQLRAELARKSDLR